MLDDWNLSFSDANLVLARERPPTDLCRWHGSPSDNGRYSPYCAVIVKRVDAQIRAKISLNELLRPPGS